MKTTVTSASVLAMIVCVMSMVFSGCTSYNRGPDFDTSKVSSIKKGETTKAELIKMFGEPSNKTSSSRGQTLMWSYMGKTSNPFNLGMGGSEETRTKMLSVQINKDKIVRDYMLNTSGATSRSIR